MATLPFCDDDDVVVEQSLGCAIGFADGPALCASVIRALNVAGFSDSCITILTGQDGIEILRRIINRSSFSETIQDILTEGVAEMNDGHSTLVIEAPDRNEAVVAANVALRHGGHGFRYFGLFEGRGLTP